LIEGKLGQFYGGVRDIIEVEICSIDGQPYTTNMRSSDAIRNIYIGALKLDKNLIIGVQVAWKGGLPVISFRLKICINIDKLPAKFTYEKLTTLDDGSITKQTIFCITKGVRSKPEDDGTRIVTFEKCGWKLQAYIF